jgi:hypothetical protein
LACATLACGLGLGLLGGCTGLTNKVFPEPSMAVRSPLAAEVKKADLAHAGYPAFFNIPDKPTDIRPTSAWTRNIYNTLRLRRQNLALEALYPQTLYGASAFAQEQRARAAPPLTPAEAAALADRTAAFAKEGRARATPPSPAQ